MMAARVVATCLVILLSLLSHSGRAVGDAVSERMQDAYLQSLQVALEDREECFKDMECDDWCKEAGAERCVCRCPRWLTNGEFSCKDTGKFCQKTPRNFWGGSFNVTSADFSKVCKKHSNLLVAFTASSCLHCNDFEPQYRWATEKLEAKGVHLARVDTDKDKEFAEAHGISSLPVIVSFNKCKSKGTYKGFHTAEALEQFATKITSHTHAKLRTKEDVEAFAKQHPVSVIGFFENPEHESDEMDDFSEAAGELQFSDKIFFGMVNSREVAKHFKGKADSKWYKQSPAVALFRNHDQDEQEMDKMLMTELDYKLSAWVLAKSIRLVDEIHNNNFVYYESLKLPMVLLFLDKKRNNRKILHDMKQVAKRYQGRLSFGWLDGEAYTGKMLGLGLTGALPALAMNTMQGGRFPFPAHETFDEGGFSRFVEAFVSGRLKPLESQSEEDAAKSAAEAVEQGVVVGLIEVTAETFKDVCMKEDSDVMTLFYSSNAQVSKDFFIYWKKIVERFQALNIKTLKVARYDISKNPVPVGVEFENPPAIVMFPAKDKSPPYKVFHGKAKVRPIMYWAQEMAHIKFEFPNDTPHLDDEQRKAYLVQIVERDAQVGAKRAKQKEERIARLKKDGEL